MSARADDLNIQNSDYKFRLMVEDDLDVVIAIEEKTYPYFKTGR